MLPDVINLTINENHALSLMQLVLILAVFRMKKLKNLKDQFHKNLS